MRHKIKNMETLTNTAPLSAAVQSAPKVKSLFWEKAEEMRFGIVPAILTIVVCISGIAGAFAAELGTLQLSIVGFPTAIFIATIIAVAPMRAIFSLAFVAVAIDLLTFIFA